jgi:hypothetical protein
MTIEIPTFEEKRVDGGKGTVVFFKMVIGFTKNNRRWTILKRYSDFDNLNTLIQRMYPNLPQLPGKTLFKLS